MHLRPAFTEPRIAASTLPTCRARPASSASPGSQPYDSSAALGEGTTACREPLPTRDTVERAPAVPHNPLQGSGCSADTSNDEYPVRPAAVWRAGLSTLAKEPTCI